MQNTAQPYTGNWYTYGQSPQSPLYNAQPQPAMKRGGMVKGYAAGGSVIPQRMAPQEMPQQMAPQQGQPVNPLMLKGLHTLGVAIGEHIKKHSPLFTGHGKVHGKGGGQDDAVPARLSQDEYVVPADIVSHLGDGSSNAGGDKLDAMVKNVRKQKAGKGFPPKAKNNPLNYIKGA